MRRRKKKPTRRRRVEKLLLWPRSKPARAASRLHPSAPASTARTHVSTASVPPAAFGPAAGAAFGALPPTPAAAVTAPPASCFSCSPGCFSAAAAAPWGPNWACGGCCCCWEGASPGALAFSAMGRVVKARVFF